MVIIDKSRVHCLKVRCCHCPNALSSDIQLFRHGFFPASFNRPKTAFTFRVLDDFLLDNLECGTLVMNYYGKLQRMTSSMFPYLVPDQCRELMRVARQWRQLKTMKWHGFGHCSDDPKAGDLTLFCLACPQPGINMSMSEDDSFDETSSWKYTQSFVMDRNFKAEHLHPIKPHDEVWLSDGLGFMIVLELIIIPGIGLWHVHGHQDSCYVWYASNFIEGIGRIDREIMETLWAHLNLISPAAQRMS
ncbi:hypothetical protein BDR04DRAFT_1128462 [Suillus decipiens]|nr:hypothetical protein BDR04DRAFT_1128462 [Suillus decipiens]